MVRLSWQQGSADRNGYSTLNCVSKQKRYGECTLKTTIRKDSYRASFPSQVAYKLTMALYKCWKGRIGNLSNQDGDNSENSTLKSEFALFLTSSLLFPLIKCVKCKMFKSCCFANLILILSSCSRCRRRRSCLSCVM